MHLYWVKFETFHCLDKVDKYYIYIELWYDTGKQMWCISVCNICQECELDIETMFYFVGYAEAKACYNLLVGSKEIY